MRFLVACFFRVHLLFLIEASRELKLIRREIRSISIFPCPHLPNSPALFSLYLMSLSSCVKYKLKVEL